MVTKTLVLGAAVVIVVALVAVWPATRPFAPDSFAH
jgi:hypothetical protein